MNKFNPSDDYKGLLRQAHAMNQLINSQSETIKHYSKKDFDTNERRIKALNYSINSEREMNANLTTEIEALRAQVAVYESAMQNAVEDVNGLDSGTVMLSVNAWKELTRAYYNPKLLESEK